MDEEPKRKRKPTKGKKKPKKKEGITINVNISGVGGKGKKERRDRAPRMRRGVKSAEPYSAPTPASSGKPTPPTAPAPFSNLSRTPAGALVPTFMLDPKQGTTSSSDQYSERKKEIGNLLERFKSDISKSSQEQNVLLLEDIKRENEATLRKANEQILRAQGIEQRGELASKFITPVPQSTNLLEGSTPPSFGEMTSGVKITELNPETGKSKRATKKEMAQRREIERQQLAEKRKELEQTIPQRKEYLQTQLNELAQMYDELNPQKSPETLAEKMTASMEPPQPKPFNPTTTIRVKKRESNIPMKDLEAQTEISQAAQERYNLA